MLLKEDWKSGKRIKDFDLEICFCYDRLKFRLSPTTFSLDLNPGWQSRIGEKECGVIS